MCADVITMFKDDDEPHYSTKYECECGGDTWEIYVSGDVVCTNCGTVAHLLVHECED